MNARPAAVLGAAADAVPEPAARAWAVPVRVALPALFVVAAVAHALASLAHVTPAIFTDEILHSKLAQSFAAGHPFSIRGEHFLFPAPLPALLQAPAWLAGSMPTGYTVAKVMNALVMSSAVFPAYAVARRFARPSWSVLAAAAAVAAPGMLYADYLLSEALAYPVFLVTVWIMLGALERPTARLGWAVLGVSLLALATRTQFAALPVAFALAALAGGRRGMRAQAIPLAGFALLAAAVLGSRGAALGPYLGARSNHYGPDEVAGWAAATGALVPFAAGLVVVPGALLGLALLMRGRRTRVTGIFLAALGGLVLLEAGLVGAGDAARPLERYAIYLPPLAVVLFLAYAERGAPWRRLHAALAIGLGLGAWAVPYASLADYRFSFDSPTLSAYGVLSLHAGHANASTVFAGGALLAGIVVAAVGVRRGVVPALVATGIAVSLALGIGAGLGDRDMTREARSTWSTAPADWLDRSGLGEADLLVLPYAPPYFGWTLEAWNRSFGRPVRLDVDDPPTDPLAASRASVRADGVLLVDGSPVRAGGLVVDDFGTRIRLEGTVVARPRPGFAGYRIPAGAHVRSLAEGLYWDGWAAPRLRYRVWPVGSAKSGRYVLGLRLPADSPSRRFIVTVGSQSRTLGLAPGERTRLVVPVSSSGGAVPELEVTASGGTIAEGATPNPRIVAARVTELRFERER